MRRDFEVQLLTFTSPTIWTRAYALPAVCDMMTQVINQATTEISHYPDAQKLVSDLRVMGCSPSSMRLSSANMPVGMRRAMAMLRGELGAGPIGHSLLNAARVLIDENPGDDIYFIFLTWAIRSCRDDLLWSDAELLSAAHAALSAGDYDTFLEIARHDVG